MTSLVAAALRRYVFLPLLLCLVLGLIGAVLVMLPGETTHLALVLVLTTIVSVVATHIERRDRTRPY